MIWHCCVCLYICKGTAALAVTIINGQAVCYDHMGLFTGGDHAQALSIEIARHNLDLTRLPECTHV